MVNLSSETFNSVVHFSLSSVGTAFDRHWWTSGETRIENRRCDEFLWRKCLCVRAALLAIDWKLFPEPARRVASDCSSTILSRDAESNPCFSSASEEIVAGSSNQRCSGRLSRCQRQRCAFCRRLVRVDLVEKRREVCLGHFFFAQIEKIVVIDDRSKEFFQFFAAALAENRHHIHLIVEMPSMTCKMRADKRSLLLLLLLLLLGREGRNE